MIIYPDEQQTKLIERMRPPQHENVPLLSPETGIPKDTVYGWRRQAQRARGIVPPPLGGSDERWGTEEQLAMVVETAVLSEAERGEYGRKRGWYPPPLATWRRAGVQANEPEARRRARSASAVQAERRRIRERERELSRKEQALAEAAARRVLRNKAQAIWGEGEAG